VTPNTPNMVCRRIVLFVQLSFNCQNTLSGRWLFYFKYFHLPNIFDLILGLGVMGYFIVYYGTWWSPNRLLATATTWIIRQNSEIAILFSIVEISNNNVFEDDLIPKNPRGKGCKLCIRSYVGGSFYGGIYHGGKNFLEAGFSSIIWKYNEKLNKINEFFPTESRKQH